jgi:hypothetical protein
MSGAEPFLLAIGTGLQVMGAIQQASAESAAAKRQAQIDERNRILADQDRQLAIRTSQIAAEDQNRENRRRLADMRAQMGSSGLELAGSPLDLLTDTSIEMALDTRRTEFEGRVRGREGAIEMQNYADSAAANRTRAKTAKTAGYTSAGAALLTGGAKAYKSFDENGYFD